MKFVIGHHRARAGVLNWPCGLGTLILGREEGVGGGLGPGSGQNDIIPIREIPDK